MEQPNLEIVQCSHCGAKNRVPLQRLGVKAKCGKCGSPLEEKSQRETAPPYLMRCSECGAKNKVPADRIDQGPVCGKCKKPLKTEELFTPQPIVTEQNFNDKVLRSPYRSFYLRGRPGAPLAGPSCPSSMILPER